MRVCMDEYDYLLHLIRCAIHGEQPMELPAGLSFETVFRHGLSHQMANIAFISIQRLATMPEPELLARWEAYYNKAVIREVNQSYAREEIVGGFQQAGIRWLELQGTKIKEFYPKPEYRTMSDIDFIVDPDNLPKARAVLERLGYQCQTRFGNEVLGFRPPNIHIEVHTEFFSAASPYHMLMGRPFENADGDGCFFLYNVLHIAKHYFYGGCGIRRVLDAYYLMQNYADMLQRESVQTVLDKADLGGFVEELVALANQWFGDASCGERSEMAGYILRSGVHGSRPNVYVNRMEKGYGGRSTAAKLQYLLRRVAGEKEKVYVSYPVLRKWKLLYPFCWLHRAAMALRPEKRRKLQKEVQAIVRAESGK